MPEMVDRDQEHLHLLKISYYCLSRSSRPSSTPFSKFATAAPLGEGYFQHRASDGSIASAR